MRVSDTVQVTVVGEIEVAVAATPERSYRPSTVNIVADWSTWILAGPFNIRIEWGDGGTSTVYNHSSKNYASSHLYVNSGEYAIAVTVTDTAMDASGAGSDVVSVAEPLSVSLTASPSSGDAPLLVMLSTSVGGGFTPYSFTLDYGDGSEQGGGTWETPGTYDISHWYNQVGVFTARVTVEDALGESMSATAKVGAGVLVEKGFLASEAVCFGLSLGLLYFALK